MNLVRSALRKPVTILAGILAILFFSQLSIRNMKVDIFPTLGLPTIYVAQPYGGLSPEQMEGFVTSYYEYHFLYVTGVKYVESKSIQGACIIKIQFQEETNMSQAMAEVVGYVNRSRAFMPPGTVPPFITRFDAGSVPVGQLVFTSDSRSLGEIQDLALFRVRPMFATLPGVSAPPPFGGNQKSVIIKVDPEKVRNYNLSPDEIVQALAKANPITPAGNVRIGDETLITAQNTVVHHVKELEEVPIRAGAGPTVYIRDIASVDIGSDVTTSYALVKGKRSVYIPVTKRADASTWDVVQRVKAALPAMQAAVPEDIRISYEFDQSGYVMNSVKSLAFEGGLGAILAGLMVLLFLGNRRSALIVMMTIPLSLLTGLTMLNLFGQTINIMTLGGLALSVGILVDMATVTIENIFQHMEKGQTKARAVLDASREMAAPLLLILLSILSVFTPALFMSGVPQGMFWPLSLSVGASLLASYFLALTFVPVMSNWMLKENVPAMGGVHVDSGFVKFRKAFIRFMDRWLEGGAWITWLFLFFSGGALALLAGRIGKEIFPRVDAGQAQVRLRLPTGTRLERTEAATQSLLKLADSLTGGNIEISSAFVGTQPSSYPINNIYLWTSGPHEAVIKFNLNKGSGIKIEAFKEALRTATGAILPEARLSFEPGDLVDQVLNLGANNPIEIAILGRNLNQSGTQAELLVADLNKLDYLRDVQVATPLYYPGLYITIDRLKAGQLGLSVDQISKSTVAATSSSRFTQPNYWLDRNSGTAYQVQVEYPQYQMDRVEELEMVPLPGAAGQTNFLREVATLHRVMAPGEYDRINQQRYVTITANIHNKDLGTAVREVEQAIAASSASFQGTRILLRGQSELLSQTTRELQSGLLIAVVVILILMTIRFQSLWPSLVVLSILPAVIGGSLGLLLLSGHSLNIQSYMGIIMAVGVAVANAILFLSNAEDDRRHGRELRPALSGIFNRLRPILMTSLAMIAGMVPMAMGMGEGGDQTAPLAVAVIGGLGLSTLSTLIFLPAIYDYALGRKPYRNPSLDPDDQDAPGSYPTNSFKP